MWLLIALLGAPPMDVTAHMQAQPKTISLDLKENLLLGDPYGDTHKALGAQLPAIEKCLGALVPAMVEGRGPTSMDLTIDKAGKVERMRVHPTVDGCLRPILDGIAFKPGRKRFGLIKLRIPQPKLPAVPAGTDAVQWSAKGKDMAFVVTARRVREATGSWRLVLDARITAEAPRGVAAASVRHNFSLLQASGRAKNGFSLQTSAGVDRCLKPGEVFTQTRKGAHPVAKGEMFSAQVFILAGDCKTGEGRYEIGTVQLDGRSAHPPILRAMPTWAYRVFERHR
jgi:hypothetical protein